MAFLPPANEVCEVYVFTCVCQSFCSQEEVGYPSMPCRWYPSMPCRSPGGSSDSHPGGVSRPTPRGSRFTPGEGCIPACTEADTPTNGQLLPQVVHILLKCILVFQQLTSRWLSLISTINTRWLVFSIDNCFSIY